MLPAGTDGATGTGHCPAPTTARASSLTHARREAGEAPGSAGRLSAHSQCFPWNSVVRRRLYKCKEVGWAERNRLQLKTQRLSVRKMLRNAFNSKGNTQDKLSMF